MATQTVEFLAEEGLTLTVKRFAIGSDTVIDTVSATEQTNRKGKYRVVYTDAPAAEYELFAFDSGVVAASWYVTLTLSTATFQAYSRAGSIPILDVPASPTLERLETDTDAIRFNWPTDGATITGQVSKAGGAYSNVVGVITQRANEGSAYWYQLAYNVADRQLGSQRYKFTDGVATRYVNLLVNSSLGANAPAGWINAAAIAADAITDEKVAADVTIASVTGAVGSVVGSVGSVTGNVGGSVGSVIGSVGSVIAGVVVTTNNDKTGYSLYQTFPTNFAALGINSAGHVSRVVLVDTTTTNTDMRGTDNAIRTGVNYTHTNTITTETAVVTITETP